MFPFDFFTTAKAIRGINQADRNYRSAHPEAPPIWANTIIGRFSKKMDTTAQRISDDLKYYADRTYVDDKGTTLSDVVGDVAESKTMPDYGISGSRNSTAKPIVYSEWTPAAQHFGMDQSTAYAEHMANTAHQREVADLRAAGLNPVLGLGSGASGVSGSVASSVGSGYTGSSSAKKDNDKFIDALGATSAVIATLVTKNPTTGGMIGTAVKALGKAFDD